MNLEDQGFSILPSAVPEEILNQLRDTLFQNHTAGERCLLDLSSVRNAALILKHELIASGHLPADSIAIQAIAFNKTSSTNWKVAWHQDVMFPFADRVTSEGFDLPTVKQGIDFARPPEFVLSRLLAVRLHLDDCDAKNGPLRISPGTHRSGILATAEIPGRVARHGEIPCLAAKGELLLMRPLCIHASSQAIEPKNRRVLHFVYDSGEPIPEAWHRTI
ncbi:MAG: phytanoyl-CoA dioxygenase family protein [Verrucomicrobiota bacterium]